MGIDIDDQSGPHEWDRRDKERYERAIAALVEAGHNKDMVTWRDLFEAMPPADRPRFHAALGLLADAGTLLDTIYGGQAVQVVLRLQPIVARMRLADKEGGPTEDERAALRAFLDCNPTTQAIRPGQLVGAALRWEEGEVATKRDLLDGVLHRPGRPMTRKIGDIMAAIRDRLNSLA